MISDNSGTIDMVAAAAAEDSRRKHWQIAGLTWTLAGTVLLAAGGYCGNPLVMIPAAIGYFVAWGALSWLSGWRRLRIPCPVCGRKSESDEAIAFRRCQFCQHELLPAPNSNPGFPGKIAFNASRRRSLAIAIFVFALSGGLFYGIAVWLWQGDFIERQVIFTAGSLPFAAAVLIFRRRHFERAIPVCPVCKVRFSPIWANSSGNCNRCGATLLETFAVEPGTPLPSPETVEQYCRTSESRTAVISFILFAVWALIDFFDCAGIVMIMTFAGMLGAGFAVSRILDRRLRRKLNLGNCPSCGAKAPWFVRPRRCPECGRRVIAAGARDR